MNKNFLIVGDFSARIKYYRNAIKRTSAKGQSTIILIPDLALISYFTRYIKRPLSILHAGQTITDRWLAWNQIRNNETKIIIGSQSALFAPVKKLGLIIIDQEENETFKNDRSPRFHAVKVASELSRLASANLVLGSITPRVETYHEALKGNYQILKKNSAKKNKIITVDMNSEKYIISNYLEKEIEFNLKNRQKILLVLNRKGEGTKFSCVDCGWIALCEKCGLPLIPQKNENVCYHCQENNSVPATCPKCQSVHLKPMGLGTARLKKFLSDLFPAAKIIQIEKEIDGSNLKKTWDIAITTSYGLKFNWTAISLVGIVDTDQGLNFPDFNSTQKVFQNIFKFLHIGTNGILQTHLPESDVIRSLASHDYEKFFLSEITQRRRFAFPPFVQLVRLLYKDINEEKVEKEANRVYKLLTAAGSTLSTVSNPHPCFIYNERGKFRWQIVIKNKKPIEDKIKNILYFLPKGWVVDVDPVNLL